MIDMCSKIHLLSLWTLTEAIALWAGVSRTIKYAFTRRDNHNDNVRRWILNDMMFQVHARVCMCIEQLCITLAIETWDEAQH